MYKAPIPTSTLANRMGQYVHAYTLYSSVRPFGITAIVGGWDSEAEHEVDGQVGAGPSVGAGGRKKDATHGGPFLYMIEPSGSYWVRKAYFYNQKGLSDKSSGLLWRSYRQRASSSQV